MTDDQHEDQYGDQHGQGGPRAGSRWDPLPQGDYDDGATAFVKLPEGGIDALLADSPLAAPGHGYVPPPITVAPGTGAENDPGSAGAWGAPPDAAGPGHGQDVRWPDPNTLPEEHRQAPQDQFSYHPGATGQWTFDQPAQGDQGPPGHDGTGHDGTGGVGTGHDASGQDVTGQWSIPLADGDLPDESGEFTTSSLVEQWGGSPPATLPGGAAAPWADEPWAQQPAGQQPPAEHGAAEIIDVSGAHADEIAVSVERDPGHDDGRDDGREEPSGAAPRHDHPEFADDPAAEQEAASTEEPDERAPDAHADATADAVAEESGGGSESEAESDEAQGIAPHNDHPLASYVLRVNGVERPVTDAWIGESLLYVLRERLGLAGAKDGCSQGECGACNVQVDGRLVASCLVPAVTAAGSEVRTVEGLAADGQPSDVQRALARCGAVQCGFCIPGMAMTVHDLLEGNPAPTDLETRQALCGNLCRCSGYRGVLEAVRDVVAEREAHAAAESSSDGDEARIPHQAGPGSGGVNPSAFEPHQSSQPHEQPYGQDGGQA
ncbi:2Fe-2S iron-sulfur cluster-binding protein [Streptomyces ortus]|uniref:2Fe-2S iron-sulfur cluster-binding protein n=1 Tax=Streptomyces ortus TaxID=2867268 RepID=A0ABT3VD74_9ACTN|nr:2Fe-2S iron-sulfur cluster-binding protein [Streptomyces ortus]MCX4236293.1 2Fe-2S iron-sulfur cluster-binding protein [Streptomyces ortus]